MSKQRKNDQSGLDVVKTNYEIALDILMKNTDINLQSLHTNGYTPSTFKQNGYTVDQIIKELENLVSEEVEKSEGESAQTLGQKMGKEMRDIEGFRLRDFVAAGYSAAECEKLYSRQDEGNKLLFGRLDMVDELEAIKKSEKDKKGRSIVSRRRHTKNVNYIERLIKDLRGGRKSNNEENPELFLMKSKLSSILIDVIYKNKLSGVDYKNLVTSILEDYVNKVCQEHGTGEEKSELESPLEHWSPNLYLSKTAFSGITDAKRDILSQIVKQKLGVLAKKGKGHLKAHRGNRLEPLKEQISDKLVELKTFKDSNRSSSAGQNQPDEGRGSIPTL